MPTLPPGPGTTLAGIFRNIRNGRYSPNFSGRPHGIVFGTCRVKLTNVGWIGKTSVVRTRVRQEYAPDKVNAYFTTGLQLVACRGPVDSVLDIRSGERKIYGVTRFGYDEPPITIDWVPQPPPLSDPDDPDPEAVKESGAYPSLIAGWNTEFGATGDVFPEPETQYVSHARVMFGYSTQEPAEEQLESQQQLDPTLVPAAIGYLTFVFSGFMGFSSSLEPIDALVKRIDVRINELPQWYAEKATIGDDMNPVHMIRECIVDLMHYLPEEVDNESFEEAADRCYNQQLGLSYFWDEQSSVEEFVKQIAEHINASIFVDRRTGKFAINLLNSAYDIEDLPLLDESNVSEVSSFTRLAVFDAVNSLTINYRDRQTGNSKSLTVTDIALVEQQGVLVTETRDYAMVQDEAVAGRIAERDLKTLSSQALAGTLQVNRSSAVNFVLGDLFKFSWADFGLSQVVMRVAGISFGDGKSQKHEIECVQDLQYTPESAFIIPPDPIDVEPVETPIQITHYKAFEVPYLKRVIDSTQSTVNAEIAINPLAGYIGTLAASPQTASNTYAIWTKPAASGAYSWTQTLGYVPKALFNGSVTKTQTVIPIDNASDLTNVAEDSWIYAGSEIMKVVSVSPTSLTVIRGCLDTIPQTHFDNATLLFWVNAPVADPVLRNNVSTLVKQATIINQQQSDLDFAAITTVQVNGRASRPYPPACVKFDGGFWPDSLDATLFNITWRNRNRLTELDPVGWYLDESQAVEDDTVYQMLVKDLSDDSTVINDVSIDPTDESFPIAGELDDVAFVRVELWAVRDGLESTRIVHEFFNSAADALHVLTFTNPGTVSGTIELTFEE